MHTSHHQRCLSFLLVGAAIVGLAASAAAQQAQFNIIKPSTTGLTGGEVRVKRLDRGVTGDANSDGVVNVIDLIAEILRLVRLRLTMPR